MEEEFEKKVYFYSDPHFGHAKIIEYSNRPFSSVEEMNETLVSRYNSIVNEQDLVYFMGDIALYDAGTYISLLKGEKILIMGNHDKRKSVTFWLKCGFKEVHKKELVWRDRYILSHHPLDKVPEGMVNIHGHIHEKPSAGSAYRNVCVEKTNYAPIDSELIYTVNNKQ